MHNWQPISTVPKDRIVWLYGDTDCTAEVKARLARWVVPRGGPGRWDQEETDCTISNPRAWAEAAIPTDGQPMDSAPRDRIIWICGTTEISDYEPRPFLGRWTMETEDGESGWEQEEIGIEIDDPQWWAEIEGMPALNCPCGCHKPGVVEMHIMPCCGNRCASFYKRAVQLM